MRIALIVALLVLAPVADAAASVVRLRIDWAPSDGGQWSAPYIYASASEDYGAYQSPCPDPANCPALPEARWVEENAAPGGRARTISFVDDSATQYRTYVFSVAHPFTGFGPDMDGTAVITHADGRTYSVPFHLTPAPTPMPVKIGLGTSEGLPAPPEPEDKDLCNVEYLQSFPNTPGLMRAAVDDFARRWRRGESLKFTNIYACGTGKITARVVKVAGGALIAKGAFTLHYAGPGRAGTKVSLTRKGRALRASGTAFKAKATIRVFDGNGVSFAYSRKFTLRGG